MQRCPKCYRTYQNDTQKYCTACGGRLVPDEELPTAYGLDDAGVTYSGPVTPPAFDPNQTIRPSTPGEEKPPAFDPNLTVANVPPLDINKTVLVSRPPLTDDIKPHAETEQIADEVAPTIAINTSLPQLFPPGETYHPEGEEETGASMATTLLDGSGPVAIAPPPVPVEPAVVPAPPVPVNPPPPPAPPVFPEPSVMEAPQPPPVAPPGVKAVPPPVVPAPPVARPPAAEKVVPPPPQKSRLPLILGGLLGLLVILGLGAAGLFWFVVKPRWEARKTPPIEQPKTPSTPTGGPAREPLPPAPGPAGPMSVPPVVPPNSVQFVNEPGKVSGPLAGHFVGFSFYYPKTWTSKPTKGTDNFADLVRNLPNGGVQEIFTISWYDSKGTFAADQAIFPVTAQKKSDGLAQQLAGSDYQKISAGPSSVNGLEAYEFRFKGEFKGTGTNDGPYWGRVIFLPPGVAGEKNGVTMIMLVTSQTAEVKSVADVGEKGDLPVILNTFRFATPSNGAATEKKNHH